jgi:rhodanese-related sulfurtransferase
VEATNQIGIYQIENLILQRVPFTLLDLTAKGNVIAPFEHLNTYYLNFFKNLILKTTETEYKSAEKFQALAKEAPIVIVCDSGKESMKLVSELEAEGYINVFYVNGGAASLKVPSIN